jgi:hypothetical protein
MRLHRLAVDVDGAGREIDTGCGFTLQVEFITSEPQEDLVMLHERLLDARPPISRPFLTVTSRVM